jgi:CDP-diacylglycerol--glycerol-3-phosphate 3-phosphatidyltransferase
MDKFTFQKADHLSWHDSFMKNTFLKLIPRSLHPNHITVFRLLTTPAVAVLMFYEHYYIGMIAFLLVAFTDVLDGSLARTRDQITEWGKLYDPIADKILIGSMVFIIVLKYIDLWAALVIVTLEIIIVILAWIRKKEGLEVQANRWGKIKMFLQVLGVTILLLAIVYDIEALLPFASGTLYLAIVFAVISLLTYGI